MASTAPLHSQVLQIGLRSAGSAALNGRGLGSYCKDLGQGSFFFG